MRSDNVLKFTRATSAVDQSPSFPSIQLRRSDRRPRVSHLLRGNYVIVRVFGKRKHVEWTRVWSTIQNPRSKVLRAAWLDLIPLEIMGYLLLIGWHDMILSRALWTFNL